MFENLSIFQIAGDLARHSAARQAVVARNLANVNTPGFQAQDIAPFQSIFENQSIDRSAPGLKTSRATHLVSDTPAMDHRPFAPGNSEQKPNGNTVFLETETLKAINAERRHSRALAIYQSSMNILKTSIGRGR